MSTEGANSQPDGAKSDMQPISYAGEPAAMAGPERFWLVDELQDLNAEDPVRVWVTWLCVYAREILTGQLPGPYNSKLGDRFVRAILMPDDEFLAAAHKPETEIAAEFNVPIEQVNARAAELAERLIAE
jgi:hypothetical protein